MVKLAKKVRRLKGVMFFVQEANLSRISFTRELINEQGWLVVKEEKERHHMSYEMPFSYEGETVALLKPIPPEDYRVLQKQARKKVVPRTVIIDDHSGIGLYGTAEGRVTLLAWGKCDPIKPVEVEAWLLEDGHIMIICPKGLKQRGSSNWTPLPTEAETAA